MIRSIIILALCLIHYKAYSQTFSLNSFDNKRAKVKIEVAAHRQLHIIYLKDTLRLLDYDELTTAKVSNDRFLMVEYRTRGGTGAAAGNTALIFCERNKLRVAALFSSYSDLSLNNGKNIVQAYKWNLTERKSTYLLQIDPIKHKAESISLEFDIKRKIFYHQISLMKRMFKINDPLTDRMSDVFVNDLVPIVNVGGNKYFNIRGNWYIDGFDGSLFKQYN